MIFLFPRWTLRCVSFLEGSHSWKDLPFANLFVYCIHDNFQGVLYTENQTDGCHKKVSIDQLIWFAAIHWEKVKISRYWIHVFAGNRHLLIAHAQHIDYWWHCSWMIAVWHHQASLQNHRMDDKCARWWQLKYFLFSPRKLGKMNPSWRSYFSNGWFNHQPS